MDNIAESEDEIKNEFVGLFSKGYKSLDSLTVERLSEKAAAKLYYANAKWFKSD